MFTHRCSIRRATIWLIACLQLFVITSYFFLQDANPPAIKPSVQFLTQQSNFTSQKGPTFFTQNQHEIQLNSTLTRSYYIDFNSSLCYHNGTDVKRMQRSYISWKCECMPNYHGSDCSQPEVIWRALLAYRKRLPLKERSEDRKIIYLFEVSDITMTISDIRVSELNNAVDLFILYEIASNSMEKQLRYGFLKQYHRKILYLRLDSRNDVKNLWKTCLKQLKSLQNDDIIIHTGSNEVPNIVALKYLKLYDFKFPEPILLRYRWSVFGFFWLHPNKTKLSSAIVTVKYLENILDGDVTKLKNTTAGFIIGDLNHFGGWFCEFCNDPGKIIDELTLYNDKYKQYKSLLLNGALKLNNLSKNQVIDVNTIEDLIENGIYIDGKTDLVKAHRFRDNYFAPAFLQENTWKYDYLMMNIYSKMDYYE